MKRIDQMPRVLYTRAYVGESTYRLSGAAQKFVQRFDATGRARPTTFVLVEEQPTQ